MIAQAGCTIAALYLACVFHVQDPASVSAEADALDYLTALRQSDCLVEWRGGVQLPNAEKPESFDEFWQYWTEEAIVTARGILSRMEQSTAPHNDIPVLIERMETADGEMTLFLENGQRRFNILAQPFHTPSFFNPSQSVVPGLLFSDPGTPTSVVYALRMGQIVSTTRMDDELTVCFFVHDQELDRWMITIRDDPQPRLVRATCEQAVPPFDRPFEDRVFIRTIVKILDWKDVDGVLVPAHATRVIDAYFSHMPRDQWPEQAGEEGHLSSYSEWELLSITKPSREDARYEAFELRHGDYVNDGRLDLGYQIGGDVVTQVGQRFRLPNGERIDGPLDESFLERLPELQFISSNHSQGASGTDTVDKSVFGWAALVVGVMLISAGAVLLMVLRHRRIA